MYTEILFDVFEFQAWVLENALTFKCCGICYDTIVSSFFC